MKKLLAMVLALVMTLSLAVSANAAFKDVKDINETYAESAEVLANLGVFKGYEDGSFNPKGDITRAEVAAIVYRIYTGDVKDVQAKNYETYNKFADMAGAGWAKGYIGYCANAAFIKGYPDGNFKPAGKVTGYEALAMILRAVGYDKNNEFTGADWALHVAQIAQKNGILDNVKGVDLNAPATREVVAELLFQSINVPMVSYTAAFGYQNVGLSTADNKFFTANKTLGSEVFGLAKVSGEISKVSYLDKTTQFTYTEDKKDKTEEVTGVDAGFENIGYEGYVWTVPGAKKTIAAVSTVYVTGESLGNSTNGTAYKNLTDKNNDAFIAENDKTVKIYKNGVVSNNYGLDNVKDDAKKVGVKVDFIDNDHNGKTDVIVVTEYTVALVSGIAKDTTSTGSNAVEKNKYYFSEGIGGYKASAVCCADELALDDLVTVVEYNKAIYVKKADFVSDTFSAINRNKVGAAPYSYDIGDKTYLVATNGYDDFQAKNVFNKDNLNKKVDIYTDPYGHIIYAKLSTADVNYLYVLNNDHTKATTGLTDTKVVFAADATEDIIGVNKVGDQKIFNVNEIDNHIYSYTENTNGSYALKLAHSGDMTASYTTKTAQWGDLGVNKNTKVIDLRAGKDNAVYTGYDEIPSLTNAKICYIKNTDGYITLAYLVSGTNTEDLTADLIVYNTNYNTFKKDENGDLYYTLDVLSDGKKVEGYKLTKDQYDYIKDLGVGEYIYDENGDLDEFIAFNETWVDAKWSDGALKDLENNKYYTINDDVKYNVLDIAKGELGEFERVTKGDLQTNYDGSVNVKAYMHHDKKNNTVTEIYVILGTPATAEGVNGKTANYEKNGTYTVKKNYITMWSKVETLNAADFLREAKLDGIVGKLNNEGDGKTAATAFELVATGCEKKIVSSAQSTLDVTAMSTDMTIKAFYPEDTATAKATSTNGVLAFVDAWNMSANNKLVFSITNKDGKTAWFHISLDLLAHNFTLTSKNEAQVKVTAAATSDTAGTIKVHTDYATSSQVAEDSSKLTSMLTPATGASLKYENGKIVVTAACGDTAKYNVEYDNSLPNNG